MRANGRDIWQRLWTKAREWAEVARDETVRVSKLGALRLEILQLSRRRRDGCERLGEKLYDLLAKGEPLSPETFQEDRGLIAELDRQISEKKAQMEGLRSSAAYRARDPGGERAREGEGTAGVSPGSSP